MEYNRHGDDFVIDTIMPENLSLELIDRRGLTYDQVWQIVEDDDSFWKNDDS